MPKAVYNDEEFIKTKIRLNRLKLKKEKGELVSISDVHDLNMAIARIYRELGERVGSYMKNNYEPGVEQCGDMFEDAISRVESMVREFRERRLFSYSGQLQPAISSASQYVSIGQSVADDLSDLSGNDGAEGGDLADG